MKSLRNRKYATQNENLMKDGKTELKESPKKETETEKVSFRKIHLSERVFQNEEIFWIEVHLY